MSVAGSIVNGPGWDTRSIREPNALLVEKEAQAVAQSVILVL